MGAPARARLGGVQRLVVAYRTPHPSRTSSGLRPDAVCWRRQAHAAAAHIILAVVAGAWARTGERDI